jgi:hypothetical protein
MNFSWYGRVRYLGETFIEYPSISYGRRWFDLMVTERDLELWLGRLHLTLSAPRDTLCVGPVLAAAGSRLLACANRVRW